MEIFKKSFLFAVGAVAVAYEEAEKLVKEQREKIKKLIKHEPKESKA